MGKNLLKWGTANVKIALLNDRDVELVVVISQGLTTYIYVIHTRVCIYSLIVELGKSLYSHIRG